MPLRDRASIGGLEHIRPHGPAHTLSRFEFWNYSQRKPVLMISRSDLAVVASSLIWFKYVSE